MTLHIRGCNLCADNCFTAMNCNSKYFLPSLYILRQLTITSYLKCLKLKQKTSILALLPNFSFSKMTQHISEFLTFKVHSHLLLISFLKYKLCLSHINFCFFNSSLFFLIFYGTFILALNQGLSKSIPIWFPFLSLFCLAN